MFKGPVRKQRAARSILSDQIKPALLYSTYICTFLEQDKVAQVDLERRWEPRLPRPPSLGPYRPVGRTSCQLVIVHRPGPGSAVPSNSGTHVICTACERPSGKRHSPLEVLLLENN
jgi:hypothetical protein